MEGSRSVRNAKEIEQLLRDYPAALELYRTGRYKVKLKNEADIERVILVEKRNKNVLNAAAKTHSKDRIASTTSVTDNNVLVQTTTSSMHTSNQSQPKVDHHRTPSKERDDSIASQQKQQTPRRSHSRDDSRSKVSHSKHKGKKSNRDYQRALVPYVPNANPAGNMWQPQHPPMSNIYRPPTFVPQQNPVYQQPYYYGQPPFPALVYQK
jgi:hypothetical protein